MLSRKGWIWVFAILVVLIISVVFVVKAKAQKPSKSGNSSNSGTGGDANTITSITGSYCNGLSKDEIKSLQAAINKKGCKDSQGNSLVEDGVFGPLSYSATMNCIS